MLLIILLSASHQTGQDLPILTDKVLEEESCGLTNWESDLWRCDKIQQISEKIRLC